MKALLLALKILGCGLPLFAQGTLQVGNSFSGVFRAPIYGVDFTTPSPFPPLNLGQCGQSPLGIPTGPTTYGGPLLQGTSFTFALFAGPVGASESALQLVTTTTFRTASGSVLPAGLINTVTVPINGVRAGEIATLQIRVWNNQGGTITSWAQVLANGSTDRGGSPIFYSQPLGGLVGQTTITPPQMTGWTSFSLGIDGTLCVPEPSVVAVAMMATVSLFIRRKPKSQSKDGTG